MSAWWCGPQHVSALLTYWVEEMGKPKKLATPWGRKLLKANMDSLAARYPDDWWEMIPDEDPIGGYVYERDPTIMGRPQKHADAYKLAGSFDYQSCEFNGWQTSRAKRLIEAIEAHALKAFGGDKDKAYGASDAWRWPLD